MDKAESGAVVESLLATDLKRPPVMEDRIDRAVAEWMTERIHGSAVARSTEAYNHLVESLPDLKARLAALF